MMASTIMPVYETRQRSIIVMYWVKLIFQLPSLIFVFAPAVIVDNQSFDQLELWWKHDNYLSGESLFALVSDDKEVGL